MFHGGLLGFVYLKKTPHFLINVKVNTAQFASGNEGEFQSVVEGTNLTVPAPFLNNYVHCTVYTSLSQPNIIQHWPISFKSRYRFIYF